VNGKGHDASHRLTPGVINDDVAAASSGATHRNRSLVVSSGSKGSEVIEAWPWW